MDVIPEKTPPLPLAFDEWARCNAIAEDCWIIVGKGPTSAKLATLDTSAHRVMTLNHAIRQIDAHVAHAIDLDVLTSLTDIEINRARFWLMPWVPHVANRPGPDDLQACIAKIPVLARLAREGRLLWYNASTAGTGNPAQPVVPVRFFSAEAALNVLALSGVRHVRTLGVDGGRTYAPAFSDVSATLLANRRSSFDRQFESIADSIFRHDLDFGPLDEEVPIRVYVATERAQMLATRVLEYSIRRRSSITTRVHAICDFGISVPQPRDLTNRPRTPFSFQRFLIPEAAGKAGRAIYLDSDMQVFKDIRALWSQPMGAAPLLSASAPADDGRRPQFSVMLLDCGRLDWDIADIVRQLDCGRLDYTQLMYEMKLAPGWRADISSRWNSLEHYDNGTCLLHYTDMEVQPWISTRNPLAYLWVAELRHALASGFISMDYLRGEVAQGFARPSLVWQMDHDLDDPLLLPREARALDRAYVPPFMSLETRGIGSPWTSARARARALMRHVYRRSGLSNALTRARNYVNR